MKNCLAVLLRRWFEKILAIGQWQMKQSSDFKECEDASLRLH